MEIASAILIEHTASKVLDKFEDLFRTHVITRWSRRRAETFFEEFCAQVACIRGLTTKAALDHALAKIAEDDCCSEVLFDAYRSVTLSRSRHLGPRVIALLTAELVTSSRQASDVEDAMFLAAEQLSDEDLIAFARFIREAQLRNAHNADATTPLRIKWYDERFDSNLVRKDAVSTGPLNLYDILGKWSTKLRDLGIVNEDIRERQYTYSPGEHNRSLSTGTVREMSWWLEVPAAYFKLVELIENAEQSMRAKTPSNEPQY